MNVLVCDDERQIVDSIIETLEKKTEETQVSSRFYGFSQPSQIDLSLPYDIALLDIDMGETNAYHFALSGECKFSALSKDDKEILDLVIDKLGKMSKNDIIAFMHKEQAYVETAPRDVIQFKYAESLQI